MRKQMEWIWEKLDESTYRAKVIGGWLVMRHMASETDSSKKVTINFTESLVFVADRDHEWHILVARPDSKKEEAKVLASDFASK